MLAKLRRLTTLAACLLLLLLLSMSTTSAPGGQSATVGHERTSSRVAATGAYADSIIHLKQWQAQNGGNGHWYAILAVDHDWNEADSISRTLSLDTMLGYLATIQGASEQRFVFDSILQGADPPSYQDRFFFGGRRIANVWGWVTGEPFCYTNWAAAEPSFSRTAITMWGPHTSGTPAPPGTWGTMTQDDSIVVWHRFWSIVEWGDPILDPDPMCGDGVAECAEECDDGNFAYNDGCNPNCVEEVCGDGIVQPWEECDDGNLVAGDGCDPYCSLQVCGNGILEPGEECDDGNFDNDDGCNAVCVLEECGDGILHPWEECDDGNMTAGDGCDPVCRTEICGNGRLDAGECCDDSNTVSGDGCNSTCIDESTVCGNGAVECSEQCDDGNLVDGDGCQSTCRFTCVPGDLNSSLTATASDAICLVDFVFQGGRVPQPCQYAGDINCSGFMTSADIIALINYLFKSMPLVECDRCARCGG